MKTLCLRIDLLRKWVTEQCDILVPIPEAEGLPAAEPTPPSKEHHCLRKGHGKPLLLCLIYEPYIWVFITRKLFYYPSIQKSNQKLRTAIILVSVWGRPPLWLARESLYVHHVTLGACAYRDQIQPQLWSFRLCPPCVFIFFLKQCLSRSPEIPRQAHLVGQGALEISWHHPPSFLSPLLTLFMWILGIKPSSPCFQGTHFPQWAIPPALP